MDALELVLLALRGPMWRSDTLVETGPVVMDGTAGMAAWRSLSSKNQGCVFVFVSWLFVFCCFVLFVLCFFLFFSHSISRED